MERLLNQIRRAGPRLLSIGLVSFIIFFLLAGSYFRWLDSYELDTLDLRFRLRPPIPRTDQAVIIEISNDTIAQLGQFPIDRKYHAFLIEALAKAGARAIVFDIFFSEPHLSDDKLAEAVRNAGNVYLPYVFDIDQRQRGKSISATGIAARSLPILTENIKGTGHINIIPDQDGKFRRVPLYIEYDNAFHPYLSFQVGCHLLGIPFESLTIQPGKSITYGKDFRLPLDEHSTMMINFSGRWAETYAHYSYVDVLRSYIAQFSGEQPLLDMRTFKDKICFIGLTAEGTADLHPNPLEPLYPSVGIHAEVINAMVNKAVISRASNTTNLIILFILILLTAGMVWRTRPLQAFLLLFLTVTMVICSGTLLFNIFGLWVDLYYPVMVVMLVYLLNTLGQLVLELKNRLILENELKIARQIQQSFLPKALPQISRVEIAARMLTARQVGGDLYDCFAFDDGQLGVMIGDVTGKGVPASLFMAMVVGAFKSCALKGVPPEETLRRLNEKLIKEAPSGLFVTLYYAVFDVRQGTMTYANGGHLPVLHIPKGHSPQSLDVEDGLPLGMIPGKYSGGQISFATGDLFIFYTDGITEAQNRGREMYGMERLETLIQQHRDRPLPDLLQVIEDDIRNWEPSHRQHDDITYIVLKVV